MKTAQIIVQSLKEGDYINQVDLLKKVSLICDTIPSRVRGSVCGDSPHKLYGQKWFKKDFVFVRHKKGVHGSRIYRKPLPEGEVEYKITYNTIAKERTRKKIFKYIDNVENPVIVTMASFEGLDVKHILNKNNNAKIYNIEKYNHILDEYKKMNLPTINLLGLFSDKIKEIKEHINIIYYDTMGYASEDHEKALSIVNNNFMCDYIAVAFINIKKFRGVNSEWKKWAIKKFISNDPTKEWIEYTMFNYKNIKYFSYNQNKDKGGRGMRVFIFKRK
ncbi:MAG: hypothetical protein M0Q13_07135 [Methanothrix sp.]|jgi:hypothetical protein|nr:hypothetical protein [Methanothrix sp.]